MIDTNLISEVEKHIDLLVKSLTMRIAPRQHIMSFETFKSISISHRASIIEKQMKDMPHLAVLFYTVENNPFGIHRAEYFMDRLAYSYLSYKSILPGIDEYKNGVEDYIIRTNGFNVVVNNEGYLTWSGTTATANSASGIINWSAISDVCNSYTQALNFYNTH